MGNSATLFSPFAASGPAGGPPLSTGEKKTSYSQSARGKKKRMGTRWWWHSLLEGTGKKESALSKLGKTPPGEFSLTRGRVIPEKKKAIKRAFPHQKGPKTLFIFAPRLFSFWGKKKGYYPGGAKKTLVGGFCLDFRKNFWTPSLKTNKWARKTENKNFLKIWFKRESTSHFFFYFDTILKTMGKRGVYFFWGFKIFGENVVFWGLSPLWWNIRLFQVGLWDFFKKTHNGKHPKKIYRIKNIAMGKAIDWVVGDPADIYFLVGNLIGLEYCVGML